MQYTGAKFEKGVQKIPQHTCAYNSHSCTLCMNNWNSLTNTHLFIISERLFVIPEMSVWKDSIIHGNYSEFTNLFKTILMNETGWAKFLIITQEILLICKCARFQ